MRFRTRASIGLALLVAACGGSHASTPMASGDDSNDPQSTALCAIDSSGACVPIGVPADACATGFQSDGSGACTPILPSASCAAGQMAGLGDMACRAVSECGTGTWGDIPVDATTEFVDVTYAGSAPSDGSMNAPWTKIADAIIAAPSNGTIAIAAGTYDEALVVDKPVKIWGTCAGSVEVKGALLDPTFDIEANGAEIHQLSMGGGIYGVFVATTGVIIDATRIHDVLGYGLFATDQKLGKAAGATIRNSLFEKNLDDAVAYGSSLTISGTTFRGARVLSSKDTSGRAIDAQADIVGATLDVSGSVFDAPGSIAIFLDSANATIASSAITSAGGRGINLQDSSNLGVMLNLSGSTIANTHEVGVATFGAALTVDATVVSNTAPDSMKASGAGMWAQYDDQIMRAATLNVSRSTLNGNHQAGIGYYGSKGTIETTWIANTAPQVSDQSLGDGIVADLYEIEAQVTVKTTRVEQSARAGISNFGAIVVLDNTVFECNGLNLDGETFESRKFTYMNEGGNLCGCSGASDACIVQSAMLTPPKALTQ